MPKSFRVTPMSAISVKMMAVLKVPLAFLKYAGLHRMSAMVQAPQPKPSTTVL